MVVDDADGDDTFLEEWVFEVALIRIALPERSFVRAARQYLEGDIRGAKMASKALSIREKPGIESFVKPAGVWSMSGLWQRFEHLGRFTCHSRPARQSGDGMDRPIEQCRVRP